MYNENGDKIQEKQNNIFNGVMTLIVVVVTFVVILAVIKGIPC